MCTLSSNLFKAMQIQKPTHGKESAEDASRGTGKTLLTLRGNAPTFVTQQRSKIFCISHDEWLNLPIFRGFGCTAIGWTITKKVCITELVQSIWLPRLCRLVEGDIVVHWASNICYLATTRTFVATACSHNSFR